VQGLSLSNDLLLSRIEPRRTFCDEKSIDENSGKPTRKYKIAVLSGLIPIEKLPFWVLTTQQTYRAKTRVELNVSDFEDLDPNYMVYWPSYACPMHYDLHTVDELITKSTDSENGFVFTGTISAAKFEEVKSKGHLGSVSNLPLGKKHEVLGIIHGEDRAREMLKDFLS
jgi:hypothetical protein